MSDDTWLDAVRKILERYDEALLRPVATKLCRPRNQWPVQELIDRSLATLQNPAVLDRRLKEMPVDTRRVLGVVRQSGQLRWPVANLCEIGAMLGTNVGHEAVVELIEAGLAFPDLGPENSRGGKVKQLTSWLAQSSLPTVIIPFSVTARVESEPLLLTNAVEPVQHAGPSQEADGLDWLLRLAIIRQIVRDSPLRRTQSREFFKRDLDRLRADALLSSPPAGAVGTLPDPDLFAIALSLALGVLVDVDGEVSLATGPSPLTADLPSALAEIYAALPRISEWCPATGWTINERNERPFASANLFALVLLGQLPGDAWAKAQDVENYVGARHPYWTDAKSDPSKTGALAFLLGIAASLRLVQLAKTPEGNWLVRLSPVGKMLMGLGGPVTIPTFQQTLLVQPNLEILAYRQGLTPELIARLGNFATWKSLGAACTLQFEPSSVYHALENGDSLETIIRTLDRHGMKPTPTPVLEALRTWADKRDRITVYPSAALFEFATAADLNEALSRGLPAIKLTDRVAVVPREQDIDYKHFRLTGTRDYCLPPEKCVEVEADGVSLVVDLARSDLLLDTELMRFAEPHVRTAPPGKKLCRITPGTMQTARQQGMSWANVESWFEQRTGTPASPAARFLYTSKETPPLEMKRQVVFHVASAEIADGLLQWPGTRGFLQERLGPTSVVVLEKDVEGLSTALRDLGIAIRFEG
ncbi:MAG: helicase-associated domain-containing protein [Planctomycetota bacterium]